jgi:hypothetical protein
MDAPSAFAPWLLAVALGGAGLLLLLLWLQARPHVVHPQRSDSGERSTAVREEVFGVDFNEVQGRLLFQQRRVMGVPPTDAHLRRCG